MKLAICIPYRDHQSGRAAAAIMASVVQGQGWLSRIPNVKLEIEIIPKYRAHVHVARQELGQRALDGGADVVLWFDDDAIPPMNLVQRLWNHLAQYDIVVPFFTTRGEAAEPQSVTYLLERVDVNGEGEIRKTRRVEASDPPQIVGMSGFHTVLMKAGALRTCYEASGGNPFLMTQGTAEDVCFFQVAFLAGLKTFCDTTVRVGHIGEKVYGITPASQP